MHAPVAERRASRREPLFLARRRYPRVWLDVDWFVESDGCSTLGRGIEISPRGAHLPIERTGELEHLVTLYVSLPERPRMFKARGHVTPRAGEKGWVIRFIDVSADDLTLLARSLIEEYGLGAFPGLDRKYQRFTGLHRRFLRTSL
jgi:hypothetical protein